MSVETHSQVDHDRLIAMFGLCTECAVADAQDRIAARAAALERREAATSREWMRRARAAVLEVASDHDAFTTDDVWARFHAARVPAALASVMQQLVDEGLIVASDEVRPAAPGGRALRVWHPVEARLLV